MKKIAEELGIPYNTYLSYETKHCEPSYNLLCKLADILHVTTDDLLGHSMKKYVYCFSEDGFLFAERFDSFEEALAAARDEAGMTPEHKNVYIGIIDGIWKPTLDGGRILDMVQEDADQDVGEAAESYLAHVKKQDVEELSELLTATFNGWAVKRGYEPYFSAVQNVKEYAL